MKKKVALMKKVLLVLVNEAQESAGMFLNVSDIGKALYGEGYMKQTSHIFDKQIKNCMGAVKELAEQQGLIVIPLREPIITNGKLDPEKTFRIIGWKIAVPGDEKYIMDELFFKKRKGEEHTESFTKLKQNARRQGIVTGERLKELSS